jgi:hypothetical protein
VIFLYRKITEDHGRWKVILFVKIVEKYSITMSENKDGNIEKQKIKKETSRKISM